MKATSPTLKFQEDAFNPQTSNLEDFDPDLTNEDFVKVDRKMKIHNGTIKKMPAKKFMMHFKTHFAESLSIGNLNSYPNTENLLRKAKEDNSLDKQSKTLSEKNLLTPKESAKKGKARPNYRNYSDRDLTCKTKSILKSRDPKSSDEESKQIESNERKKVKFAMKRCIIVYNPNAVKKSQKNDKKK